MSAVIRLAEDSDAEAIRAIYAPIVETTVISFEQQPPSRSDIAERLSKGLVDLPWLVCERDGKVLGYAYAGRHRARRLSMVGRILGLRTRRRAAGGRGPRAVSSAVRRTAFSGLFQPIRRHHAAQSRQRGISRIRRLPADRRLLLRRFQIRGLARRGLVATEFAGSPARADATDAAEFDPR